MILDFTIRLETNPDHAEADVVKNDMVALYKSFMRADSEDQRQNAVEMLLMILEETGLKEEYTVRTFATITR